MSAPAIKHPGPPAPVPALTTRGQGRMLDVTLKGGQSLMAAVAQAMDAAGVDTGVMVVDGLIMGPYDYVMPGPSNDGVHAAWYSKTHSGTRAQIIHGSAIVGRREGAWWLHCHAVWADQADASGKTRCGHLLPDDVSLPEDEQVTLYGFDGGMFDVALDEQTMFPVFHPKSFHPSSGQAQGNALIAKVAPHHDIFETIQSLIEKAGFQRARVVGIGSLIGARFAEKGDMASPISEVLILPGALWTGELTLPMYCVDPDDGQFQGHILPGGAPVCVTFELLVIEDA